MTEASYTAWDDKQYVWPPPDGWYEASDGKWWPQGYGPPVVAEPQETAAAAAVDAVDGHVDAATDVAGQALSDAGIADAASSAASGMNGWAGDEPELDVAADASAGVSALGDSVADLTGNADLAGDLTGTADLAGASGLTGNADLAGDLTGTTEYGADAVGLANGVADSADSGPAEYAGEAVADPEASTVIGGMAAAAPSAEHSVPDNSTTVVGSEGFDASTSAATQAFGTGLMPPMADRPAPAGAEVGGGDPVGFDAPGVSGPPRQDDLSAHAPAAAPESFHDLAAAAPVSSPPPMDHVAEQQAILDAKPKGSSRGLLFAILGVVALVIIGAALFFALGGDDDADTTAAETVATGPGSVSEPHPRVTGVVVFYPDAGVEQRWIIEVLEPVRDVTEEFENDGTQMLAATRIRVTNDSGADGANLEDLRFNLVDASGAVTVRTDNTCPPGVEDFGYGAAVAVEASVEGTVCWAIPSGDLAGLMLGIESSKVQGRVHIQLQ